MRSDLLYDFPEAGWLFFFAPVIVWLYISLRRYRWDTLSTFATQRVLSQVLLPRNQTVFWIKTAFLTLTWLLATYALMGPKGGGYYPNLFSSWEQKRIESGAKRPHEVLLLLDTSASMGVKDTPSGTSRLESGKGILNEIVGRLTGQEVALYAFTASPQRIVPPTLDYLFTRLLLRDIQLNEGGATGTDFSHVLKTIRDKHFANASPKLKTVVIVSDGGDTFLESLEDEKKAGAMKELQALLGGEQGAPISVFTVGVGSLKGGEVPGVTFHGEPVHSSLQEGLLQALSEKGEYFRLDETSPILLADQIGEQIEKLSRLGKETVTPQEGGKEGVVYALYFQIPLGFAILLLSYCMLYPDTGFRRKQSTSV